MPLRKKTPDRSDSIEPRKMQVKPQELPCKPKTPDSVKDQKAFKFDQKSKVAQEIQKKYKNLSQARESQLKLLQNYNRRREIT